MADLFSQDLLTILVASVTMAGFIVQRDGSHDTFPVMLRRIDSFEVDNRKRLIIYLCLWIYLHGKPDICYSSIKFNTG